MESSFNFATILKDLRHEKKLTQTQLANILSVSQDTVSLWENSRSYPDFLTLRTLAKLFDVSADYLLGLQAI